MLNSMMTPILALIIWTFVMWAWMYATRIPAMAKQHIRAGDLKRAGDLSTLPPRVLWVTDNYNNLHEQPTVFYALCVYSHLVGVKDELNVGLAWLYVALRIIHSFVQVTSNYVPLRFWVFVSSSLALMAIAGRNVFALVN